MARQAGIQVVVLRAAKTGADFAQAVMQAESLADTTSDATAKEGVAGVSAVLRAQGRSARTRLASETRTERVSLDAAIERRLARDDGLLLVLDEAHTLRKDAGQELFNTYQDGGVRGAALGLAFAGTPDLPDRLSEMGATFTERPGPHGQQPLGPISDANAVMAVLAPFAERGAVPHDMEPDAPGGIAEGIASACCGYPYYTQLLGAALHQAWAEDGAPSRIAERHWRQALSAFEMQRREHYQRRFAELRTIGAVQCARNLAVALKERGAIAQDVLEQCVAQGRASGAPWNAPASSSAKMRGSTACGPRRAAWLRPCSTSASCGARKAAREILSKPASPAWPTMCWRWPRSRPNTNRTAPPVSPAPPCCRSSAPAAVLQDATPTKAGPDGRRLVSTRRSRHRAFPRSRSRQRPR